MSQTVYLCARYSRHEELNGYAEELRRENFHVCCEWITGAHHDTDSATCAEIDYDEVERADIVISFTERPGEISGRGRGGRHVEYGIALALHKRCIVVGYRENVFHHMPQVEFYPLWRECLESLGGRTDAEDDRRRSRSPVKSSDSRVTRSTRPR